MLRKWEVITSDNDDARIKKEFDKEWSMFRNGESGNLSSNQGVEFFRKVIGDVSGGSKGALSQVDRVVGTIMESEWS